MYSFRSLRLTDLKNDIPEFWRQTKNGAIYTWESKVFAVLQVPISFNAISVRGRTE